MNIQTGTAGRICATEDANQYEQRWDRTATASGPCPQHSLSQIVIFVMIVLSVGVFPCFSSRSAESAGERNSSKSDHREEQLAHAKQLRQQADAALKAGKLDEALSAARESASLLEKHLGENHKEVAEVLTLTGVILARKNAYAEARPLLERALRIHEKTSGAESAETARALQNLAAVHLHLRDQAGALIYAERAARIREKLLGGEHPELAESLRTVAAVKIEQRDFAAAQSLLERVLKIREKQFGEVHLEVATALEELAYARLARFDVAGGRPLVERIALIREKLLGASHPDAVAAREQSNKLAGAHEMFRSVENLLGGAQQPPAEQKPPPAGAAAASSPNLMANLFSGDREDMRAHLKFLENSTEMMESLLGPRDSLVGVSRATLGAMLLQLGEFDRAQQEIARGLQIEEASGGANPVIRAQLQGGLAIALSIQGDYSKAQDLLARARRTVASLPDSEGFMLEMALLNLSMAYAMQEDWLSARALTERLLRIIEKREGPRSPQAMQLRLSQVGTLMELGDYAEASVLAEEIIASHEATIGKDHPTTATAVSSLGRVLAAKGEYRAAQAQFERAAAILEKHFGPRHLLVAEKISEVAALLELRGDYAAAAPLRQRVVEIYREKRGDNDVTVAGALNMLAYVQMELGQMDVAAQNYERAMKILRGASVVHSPMLRNGLFEYAIYLWRKGDKDMALRTMEESCQLLESHRLGITTDSGRSQFLESEISPLTRLTLWLGEMGRGSEAFVCAERARARALLDALADSRARVDDALPRELAAKRMELIARLNLLERQRRDAAQANRPLDAITASIRKIEEELELLAADIRRAHPRYDTVTNPQPMEVRQLAASGLMDQQTALISFTSDRRGTVALVLDSSGKTSVMNFPAMEEKTVRVFGEIIAAVEKAEARGALGEKLHELYQTWFAPLEKWLGGKKRLIIVADGALHLLPFEMLLAEKPSSDNLAEWAWLVKKYEIHYAPSGTVLAQLKEEGRRKKEQKGKGWEGTLVAVADPPFSEQQAAEMRQAKQLQAAEAPQGAGFEVFRDVGRLFYLDSRQPPPRLPGTRREAESLQAMLGKDRTTLLLGEEATEAQVWKMSQSRELAKYRYVHFATHGWVDTNQPLISGLLLSLADKSEEHDGLLQMREIFALKLDADLVVLSACQTGRGKLMRGEGIVGLSQAFFYAGTPSLVVSLWNVNDASTALLMKRFYGNLIERRMTKSAALREAKLWLMTLTEQDLKAEDKALAKADTTRGLGAPVKSAPGKSAQPYAHPRHWAPFILIGDSE